MSTSRAASAVGTPSGPTWRTQISPPRAQRAGFPTAAEAGPWIRHRPRPGGLIDAVLLDTHTALWLENGDERRSTTVSVIEDCLARQRRQ